MTTSKLERTYVSIDEAQHIANKLNAFVDWFKTLEGFHSAKELREMYWKDESENRQRLMRESHASQMGAWCKKMVEAGICEVRVEVKEITFTDESGGWVYENGLGHYIEVIDANGNTYTMRNPAPRHWENKAMTKTVHQKIKYYTYKGE